MVDGEWTGQRRWKKHTGGNDERKWCAWWVLNGWPVGQTLSDCLLKGWKTERERERERDGGIEDKKVNESVREQEKNDDRCQNTITLWQPRFSLSCASWTLHFPAIVPRLCHAAIANQWMITDLKGSDRKSGQAACFIQLVLHKFCVVEYFL